MRAEWEPQHVSRSGWFALADGDRDVTTPKSRALGNDSFKAMGVDFVDMNHDGLSDIDVSNIADSMALHESHFVWLSNGQPKADCKRPSLRANLSGEGCTNCLPLNRPIEVERKGVEPSTSALRTQRSPN